MNNQNQFEEEKFEEEKKEVPPTPPPFKAGVRTMQSDFKSVQESGGQAPQPYSIEIDQAPTVPLPPSPQKPSRTPTPAPEIPKPKSKKTKIILIILGILVLLIILGWLGYYFIKISIPANFSIPSATPKISSPALTPTSTPVLISNEEIILSPLTLKNFQNILKAATANVPLNNSKELILLNEDRTLINLSDLLPLILPELNKEEIARFFSENFSLTVWVDKNGSWPVFVVQIKPTAALIGAQTFIKEKIEASTQRTNLHYGWVKDKLIISPSASGYSAILEKIK